MPVVTNTIHAPGGAVQAGILVEITPSGEGFFSADGHWIAGCTRIRTDAAGTWSGALETNVGSDPTPSYYTVVEHVTCGGCGGKRSYDIQVTATPATQDVQDIVVAGVSVPSFFLSDELPVALAAVAAPGTCIRSSRCDHVHPQTGLFTDAEFAAHEADTTNAHLATGVSFAPASGIAATNVQAAIVEAKTDAEATAAAALGSHQTTVLGDAGQHPSRILPQATASLPAGTLGDLRYLTDGARGVHVSRGSGFYPLIGCVNVKDFGLKGDGTAEVRADVVAAFTAAASTGKPLYWPSGTYLIQFGCDDLYTGTTLFSSNTSLPFRMYGEGAGQTILQFKPDASGVYAGLDFRWTAFYLRGAGRQIDITDITFQHAPFGEFGALAVDFNNQGGGTAITWEPTGTKPSIRFARCTWTNPWSGLFRRQGGNNTTTDPYVEFVDCPRMDFLTGVQLQGASTPATAPLRPRFYMENCHLTGYQNDPLYPGTWTGQGHGAGIYAWPDTSCLIKGSRFSGIGGSMQHSSVSGTFSQAAYVIYDGCVFEANNGEALLTPDFGDVGADFVTQIQNCTFYSSSPAIRCNTRITNTMFYEGGGLAAYGNPTNVFVDVEGCRFYSLSVRPSGVSMILAGGTGSTWRFKDCYIEGETTGGGALINVGSVLALDVQNTTIKGRGANLYFMRPKGVLKMRGVTFEGAGTIYIDDAAQMTQVDIDDCDGRGITGIDRMFTDVGGLPTNIIRGTGNKFRTGVTSSFYTLTNPQQVTLQQGLNPTAVASAATVVIPVTHDIHHISGTTAIDTIHVGDSDITTTRCFSGATVRLIPDAAWSLTAAGNIVPRTLGPREVNSPIYLIYDGGQAKWLEVTPPGAPKLLTGLTTSATPGTRTTHAHGLGYTPTRVVLIMTAADTDVDNAFASPVAFVKADATNITVKSRTASVTFRALVS